LDPKSPLSSSGRFRCLWVQDKRTPAPGKDWAGRLFAYAQKNELKKGDLPPDFKSVTRRVECAEGNERSEKKLEKIAAAKVWKD
jgi:hypothetical protein